MSLFDSTNINATALTAQRLRMDVISENIANASTTRTADGGPYKRKSVLFSEIPNQNVFSDIFGTTVDRVNQGKGVRVRAIVNDESLGPLVYDPSHPDADGEGYVRMPNVNIVQEMVNMISASRSYEANVTAMNTTKSMVTKTLDIGR